ncbi:MAG: PhoH family protein [Bryobacteraceae bacterium]|nr:PhoH family protein [Bryobacteraceae bacterium]
MKVRIQLNRGLEPFFGTRDENIRLLESGLGVSTRLTPDALEIEGPDEAAARAERIVLDYLELTEGGQKISPADVNSLLHVLTADEGASLKGLVESGRARNFGKKSVVPKTVNQRTYLDTIERLDLTFGIGPAGTGKTYLAVAMAVSALLNKQVDRIILTRPAVEAGERLGFLPGTLQEKIDPYLRPLYDALFDMLDSDRVEKALERNIIEIAPLAFMRGRTLNNAFIILDEAQNSTAEQMKMMLTRIGYNSKLVVTGDLTQIDLPLPKRCGLQDALDVLRGVEGLGFVFFDGRDVVRNRLVQRIVEAYERFGDLTGTARQMALPMTEKGEPPTPDPQM